MGKDVTAAGFKRDTLVGHLGRDPTSWKGAVNPPVYHTSTVIFESLEELLWSFVGGSPRINSWKALGELPAETAESKDMSKELKRRGFRFVGPTVCYAFMQAGGLVNDHVVGCFRYAELSQSDN